MTDPGSRPEPVLDQAKIASVISGAAVAVVSLVLLVVSGKAGDLTALELALEAAISAVAAAVAVVAPLWRARKARAKVTPLEDPQTSSGVPLVSAPIAQVQVAEDEHGISLTGSLVDHRTPGVAAHEAPEEEDPQPS